MSSLQSPPSLALHRLTVEADADPNALLRLLEPFVIHDVTPHRLSSERHGESFHVRIEFAAEADLAHRLEMRLTVLPVVRSARLDHLDLSSCAAA